MKSSQLILPRCAARLAAFLCFVSSAGAVVITWDGSTSNSWLNVNNWSSLPAAPLTDDELVFPAAGANKSMDNDLGAGLAVNRLTFSGSGYTLNGDSITLSSTAGTPLLRATHTSGTTTLNSPFALAEASTFSAVAGGTLSSTFGGTVALGASRLTLDADGAITLLGTIGGTGGVTLIGPGTVTFGGSQEYSGTTLVNAGTLRVISGASVTASALTVADGAILTGAGTVDAVTVIGTVQPATSSANTIGRLTAAGDVTFSNTASPALELELGAPTTPGTTYDQFRCQGKVNFAGSNSVLQLTATGTFAPAVGQTYTLLDKTSGGLITGTFSGLPQGSLVDLADKRLLISYAGGDGNDLTATVVNATPTITDVSDLAINEDSSTAALAFTIGDLETAAGSLTVTRSSSNTTLVPLANVAIGGSGANPTVTVTPAANQNGSATITLTVSDGAASASSSFVITVNPVNDPPVFTKGSNQTVNEDAGAQTASAWATGVGDGDAEANQSLTFNVTNNNNALFSTQPQVSPSGSLTYTPAPNANGSATVSVTLTDDATAGGPALTTAPSQTFTISVTAVNDAPVATGQAVNTNPNHAASFTLGATDVENGVLTYSIVTPPANGVVSGGTGAVRTYTPNLNFHGADSFTFRAGDGTAFSNVATVSITVNGPPGISDIPPQMTAEDTPTPPIGFTVSDDATDPGALTLSRATSNAALVPLSGIVFGGSGANRTVTVTPAANQTGTVTITVTVSDGVLQSNDTFTLTINPVNDPPVTNDQTFNVTEDVVRLFSLPASDPDGDALVSTILSPPLQGTLSGTGINLTYTPGPNFNGSDSFTFTVNDGTTTSPPATVSLNIAAVNDTPAFTKGPVRTVEANSGPQTFPAWATGISDGDPEVVQNLTFNITTNNNALFAALPAITPDGNLTFTPAANAFGVAALSITLTDDSTAGGAALTSPVQTVNLYIGFLPPQITVGGPGAMFSSLTGNGGVFAAVNQRTQRENLVIQITGDLLSETGAVALNPPFVEPSGSQFTIRIFPAVAPRRIEGLRFDALIRLNGVDRVTVDGSLGGTGTDRSLTISNTYPGSQAVLWLQTAVTNGATDNTLRNLIVSGNSSLLGIGSGGSTISLTSDGAGNSRNTFSNNSISSVQWGLYSGGVNEGTVISGNEVTAAAANNVTRGGILIRHESGVLITNNRITGITGASGTGAFGISLGLTDFAATSLFGAGVAGATVTGNTIRGVSNTGSGSAAGIAVAALNAASPAATFIANNVVSAVGSSGVSGNFGAGILIGGGTNMTSKVLFNSVSLSGNFPSSGLIGPNFAVAVGGVNTVVEMKNNVLSNTASSPGSCFAIGLASATFAGLDSDRNDLYVGTGAGFKTGRAGSLARTGGTDLTALANWQAATGQDSTSFSLNPRFNSDLNLQSLPDSPLPGTGIPLPSVPDDINGLARSTTSPTPGAYESTADASPPVITFTPLGFTLSQANRILSGVNVTDFTGVETAGGLRPRIYYRRATDQNVFHDNTSATAGWKFAEAEGSSGAPFSFVMDYARLSGGTGVAPGDVVHYFVVAQDIVPGLPNTGTDRGTLAAAPSSVALTADAFPISGTVSSYEIRLPIGGTVTVGLGGDFPNLTLPGGLFDALNRRIQTSDLEVHIISDLPNETGISLNPPAVEPLGSLYAIRVFPVGSPRIITCGGNGVAGFVGLLGVDRFTLDGSLGGTGNDRSLTITCTQETLGAVIRLSNAGGDGATDNTLRNLIISGSGRSQTEAVISSGDLFQAGAGNNRNVFRNNVISRAKRGIISNGASTGTVIADNELTSPAPDNLFVGGIFVGGEDNIQIMRNRLANIGGSSTADPQPTDVFGISLGVQSFSSGGNGVTNAIVTGNTIRDVTSFPGSAIGLACQQGSLAGGSTVLITNNAISGIGALTTSSTVLQVGAGIYLAAGGAGTTTRILHNSVSLSGSLTLPFSSITDLGVHYALAVAGSDPALELKNNVFANTLVYSGASGASGRSYAVGLGYGTSINLNADYNDYFIGTGPAFQLAQTGSLSPTSQLGSGHATLADFRNATLRDDHSLSADPLFTSAANLIPLTTSPLKAAGVPLVAVGTDILGATRHTTQPTIGAYELDTVALSALDQWRFDQFGTASNTGSAANDFDFDFDGLSNLVEFAFGLDPKSAASAGLPQPVALDINADHAVDFIVLGFIPPPGVSGVTFEAEMSATLAPGTWTSVPNTGVPPLNEFRLPVTGPAGFMRMSVKAP